MSCKLRFEKLEERHLLCCDTIDTASFVFLTPGSPTGVGGDISPEHDVDIYAVNLSAGDSVSADVDAQVFGSSLDSVLRVFDSSGADVAFNDDSDGTDSALSFQAPIDDTYFIGVSSYPNFSYDPHVAFSGSGNTQGFYELLLLLSVNNPPTISGISDQTTKEDAPTATLLFSVDDAETPASLSINGASSDQNVIPDSGISFGGSGANRTVTVFPAINRSGTSLITVTVDDGSGGSASTAFTVTVDAVADGPFLSAMDVQGFEDTSIPLSINASLADTDGSESLSILISGVPAGASLSAGTNNGGGSWSLSPAQLSGLSVTPASNVDSDFSLSVSATATELSNGNTAQNNASFLVDVVPLNDSPDISDHSFNVNENSAGGTTVGTVSASDPDAGDTHSFSIVGGNAGNAFSIGAASGQITVNNPPGLDHESQSQYSLSVSVADNGGLSDTATVTVSVNDVNEPPTIGNQSFSVNENSAGGTSVGTVSASDFDAGDTRSFSIVGGNTGNAFSIGAASGQISLNNPPGLNHESQSQYSLSVRVTDSGGLFDAATVTVNVNDVNEPPTIGNQSFSVDENSTAGSSVGTVSASDPDAGDTHSFSIVGGNSGNAFSIGTTSGQVSLNNPPGLNHEFQSQFSLSVRVTDSGGLFDTATVTVNVNDINESPTIGNQSFSVDENSAGGTTVGTVSASDPDAGDTRSFSIVGGNTGNAFSIGAASGQISLNNPPGLNHESQSQFSLSVRVTDSGGLFDTATVTVNVNDVNEPPSIGNQSFSVDENSAAGTSVGTVSASDPDAGDTRSFSIEGGNTGNAFSIGAASGQISLNNPPGLNHESQSQFSLSVRVTDSGGLFDTATVTVNVNDVNETPTIGNHLFSVDENSAAGTSVGTVSASDPDAGDTHSFSIVGGNTGNVFSIGTTSGQISLNNPPGLNHESQSQYSLSVRVTDSGGLFEIATVTIDVNDVNETPTISNQSFQVNENSINGTVVGTVLANDVDAGQSLAYAVIGGTGSTAFAVSSTSGRITVVDSTQLNFETAPMLDLQIRVTDSGNPSQSDTATATVSLTDVAEAAPTADIIDLSPNPRVGAVDEIKIEFSAPVTGLDRSDLTLTRTLKPLASITVENLLLDTSTLASLDNVTWTLGNLNTITAALGVYELTLVAANSGIRDADGRSLAGSTTEQWVHGAAGDTNLNGEFDQFDLLLVQFEGGYARPGQPPQPADWFQGDWNLDGVFDRFDIMAALDSGNYRQGPYTAAAPGHGLRDDSRRLALGRRDPSDRRDNDALAIVDVLFEKTRSLNPLGENG